MLTHDSDRELVEIELENQEDIREIESNVEVADGLMEISRSLEAFLELKETTPALENHDASYLFIDTQFQRLGLEKAVPDGFRWSRILEVLKKVWETIKNAIAETYAMLRRVFIRLFTGFDRIKRRSESLRNRVRSINSDAVPGVVSVQAPRRLSYRRDVSYNGIRKGMDGLIAVGRSVHGDYLDAAVGFYDDFESFIGALRTDPVDSLDKKADKMQAPKLIETLSGTGVMLNTQVLGDRQFQYSASHSRKIESTVSKIDGGIELPTPPMLSDVYEKSIALRQLEMGALTKSNMLAILDDLIGLADICLRSRRSVEKIIDSRAKMIKDMDRVLAEKNRQGTIDSEEMTKIRRYIRSGMTAMQKMLIRPISQHSTHSFNVSRSLLVLIERSISAHS